MNNKIFIVVELPKDETGTPTLHEAPQTFEEYDQAFDALQEAAPDTNIKRPKGISPIRVELKHSVLELWLITRTETGF